MKPTAVFEELRGDIVGLVRVYDTADTVEPAEYKFFTSAVITDGVATLKGLKDCDGVMSDLKAIELELYPLGARYLEWTHDGKPHRHKIRKPIFLTAPGEEHEQTNNYSNRR